jgi:farnesyl diphosphate synthase
MKTGALIRFACEAGAILGYAEASQRRALVEYGERLGAAFQIADDLLDVEGEVGVMGKAAGKDAGQGHARIRAGRAGSEGAARPPGGTGDRHPGAVRASADILREAAAFVCGGKRS